MQNKLWITKDLLKSIEVKHRFYKSVNLQKNQSNMVYIKQLCHFFVFINDLHKAVEFSPIHHFVHNTDLLLIDKSLKKIDKYINRDFQIH